MHTKSPAKPGFLVFRAGGDADAGRAADIVHPAMYKFPFF